MTKIDAIRIFGNQAALGRALGLSRSRISQWGDQLTQRQADEVLGAALRLGKIRADQILEFRGDRDRPTAGAQEPADAGSQTTRSTADAAAPTVDGEAA